MCIELGSDLHMLLKKRCKNYTTKYEQNFIFMISATVNQNTSNKNRRNSRFCWYIHVVC